jgi:hypothetical protein
MRIAVVLAVMLAGCAGGQLLRAGTSPVDEFGMRWRGRPEDDVLMRYGTPTERISLSTGNTVDSYHRESGLATSSTAQYGNVGGGSSSSSTVFCDRRFEVDRNTRLIVRAVILGSGCNYEM